MLTKFWESTGETLSGKWLDQLFSPAFIFWGGGLIIIASRYGFNKILLGIQALTIDMQVAIVIVSFLVLSLSSAIVEQLRYVALRLLEGYLPWPFNFLGKPFIAIHQWKFRRALIHWNELKSKEDKGILTPDERNRMSKFEKELHYYPTNQDDFLSTSFGNAIRAGEQASHYKYGLDAVVCWTRLWMLLPSETKEDLNGSRESLDNLVKLVVWGILFLIWTWWWPWAILIGAIWILFAYAFAVQGAMTYADLIESAFDLYRFELYKAARWSLPPKSGQDEVNAGKKLTEFLWRGTTEKPVKLIHPDD